MCVHSLFWILSITFFVDDVWNLSSHPAGTPKLEDEDDPLEENWPPQNDKKCSCIYILHSNLDITNLDIVNKTQLPFWGFTKHITYLWYSELFYIVNKKVLTNLFVISRFECTTCIKSGLTKNRLVFLEIFWAPN